MCNMDIYTVRYWIGPVHLKDCKPYSWLIEVLDAYKDLMPMYTINEEEDLWLYCTYPMSDVMKKIIHSYTNGFFYLWKEFEL